MQVYLTLKSILRARALFYDFSYDCSAKFNELRYPGD